MRRNASARVLVARQAERILFIQLLLPSNEFTIILFFVATVICLMIHGSNQTPTIL